MTRQEIYSAIETERAYQQEKWGDDFDRRNTPNDWLAYVLKYAGQAVTMPFDNDVFRKTVLKVATLCVAALEQPDYAARHYDRVSRDNLMQGRV